MNSYIYACHCPCPCACTLVPEQCLYIKKNPKYPKTLIVKEVQVQRSLLTLRVIWINDIDNSSLKVINLSLYNFVLKGFVWNNIDNSSLKVINLSLYNFVLKEFVLNKFLGNIQQYVQQRVFPHPKNLIFLVKNLSGTFVFNCVLAEFRAHKKGVLVTQGRGPQESKCVCVEEVWWYCFV